MGGGVREGERKAAQRRPGAGERLAWLNRPVSRQGAGGKADARVDRQGLNPVKLEQETPTWKFCSGSSEVTRHWIAKPLSGGTSACSHRGGGRRGGGGRGGWVGARGRGGRAARVAAGNARHSQARAARGRAQGRTKNIGRAAAPRASKRGRQQKRRLLKRASKTRSLQKNALSYLNRM
jgi:hypothetical protein